MLFLPFVFSIITSMANLDITVGLITVKIMAMIITIRILMMMMMMIKVLEDIIKR